MTHTSTVFDLNSTTYTVFYKDGRIQTGLTFDESIALFEDPEAGVRSLAPTTEDTF